MLHKIRYAMGKRDDNYTLCNEIELDEGFFEIVPNKDNRDRIAIELKENGGKAEHIKNFPYPRQFATLNRFFV